MSLRPAVLIVLAILLSATSGRTLEKPRLLADVVPGDASGVQLSLPGDFIRVNGRLLFSTLGSRNGDEGILWSTDGTAAGTVMVSSALCPSPCTAIRPLGTVGDVALLAGISESGGSRLWRSDGTPEGTFLLPGPLTILSDDTRIAQNLPGFLLFVACDDATGCEIWRSDGTREGTEVVSDIYPGLFGSYPRHLTAWRGRVYFLAETYPQTGLWSTDGTAAGTRFVAPSSADLDREENVLVATPSRLFFTSLDSTDQLWTSDGTPAGTRLVRRFPALDCPNPHYCPASFLTYLQPAGDEVYFPAGDGTQVELWASDGTRSGTRRLTDFSGRANLYPTPPWKLGDRWVFTALAGGPVQRTNLWTAGRGFTDPSPLTGCRGGCPDVLSLFPGPIPAASPARLLFVGTTPSRGAELWSTDGTAAGTRRLTDVCPDACNTFSPGYTLPVLGSSGGRTYFLAVTTPNGAPNELWTSDGTPAGTYRVAGDTRGIGTLDGRVYYGAMESSRLELWSTDGRPGGGERVSVLNRAAAGSSPLIATLGNLAVMITFEGDRQRLWRSDGTPAGTVPLPRPDVSLDQAIFDYAGLFQAGGLLYFDLRRHPFTGYVNWDWALLRTDGTSGGTRRVATAPAGTNAFFDPIWRRDWNGELLFVAGHAAGSSALCSFWTSDGTAPGTREILPLPAGTHCPIGVEPFGSRFLFLAAFVQGGSAVPQLFVSDGTPEGTRQLTAFQETRVLIDTEMVHAGGRVLFRLTSADEQDVEVWRTDGTPEGTARIPLDLHQPTGLYVFRDAVYFSAYDIQSRPPGLYRMGLDGGQPTLLADADPEIYLPYVGPQPAFVPVGDRLFFAARDHDHGRELWVTDGTAAGTHRVRDVQPGPGSSEPRELTAAGGLFFFTADDGEHGRELWVSDGTETGTRIVDDLNPGGFSSHPMSLAATPSTLFFAADDGTTGIEPWALPLAPP
jgi:ELWxxDGT repeat protein